MIGFLLASALVQPVNPALDPPTLTSGEFKGAVLSVRRQLAAGQFSEAEKAIAALPKKNLVLSWDDKGVPADLKSVYLQARDEAIKVFASSALAVKVTVGSKNPDIKVSFTETLPFIEGTQRRQAAVFFTSFSPGDAKVDAVIALQRGLPPRPAGRRDIAQEVLHSIGLSLGLTQVPREGGAMGRIEGPVRVPPRLLPSEILDARRNLEIVDLLRARLAKKVKDPVDDNPLAVIDTRSLNGGEALQGDPMLMTFQVSNPGKSELRYQIVPDCSCFGLEYRGIVSPGGVSLVKVGINTRDFIGLLHKSLYIYTNDPDKSVVHMPFTGKVNPIYRFIHEGDEDLVLVGKAGATHDVFLVQPEGRTWAITDVVASPKDVKVAWEAWTGVIADSRMDEAPRTRTGYRLRLTIPARKEPGRLTVTLQAKSTDPDFPVMDANFSTQYGIISQPASVYFGELGTSVVAGWTQIVRPGRPFRILKAVSDDESVTPSFEPLEEGGYRLKVVYNGKAPSGSLSATIVLTTDDPEQKEIRVPVTGVVK